MTHNNASAHSLQHLSVDHKPPIRVLELFAGVGGFHLGLEQVNEQRRFQGLSSAFEVVWGNQWEPASKVQHAAQVYESRWGLAPVNRDLFAVLEDDDELARIDSLAPDMLVGGFPCQDYSVAKPLSQSHGLAGAKGALWWGIHRLLEIRQLSGKSIQIVMLENVDRLLSSPGKCKGRDFATILVSLQALGYAVAWQVVNAADYGCAQRRRRVFIVAVHQSSAQFQSWQQGVDTAPLDWLIGASPMSTAYPVKPAGPLKHFLLPENTADVDVQFSTKNLGKTPFLKSGVFIAGNVWTIDVCADFSWMKTLLTDSSVPQTLGQVMSVTTDISEKFFIAAEDLPKWRYLKGRKSEPRVTKGGYAYQFSEGALSFPEPLDKPSRTILTSEVGASASRTRHIVQHTDGRLRRLTPEETEALMGFPRGFTALPGISDTRRGFLMGNALVPALVARLGHAIFGKMMSAQSKVCNSLPNIVKHDESVLTAR